MCSFKNLIYFTATFFCLFLEAASLSIDSIDFYYRKARAFEYKNIDSIKFYAQKIVSYSDSSESKSSDILYYSLVGVGFQNIGEYDSSIMFQKRVIELSIERKDTTNLAIGYQNLGVVYKFLGNYEEALIHFFNALSITEKGETTAMCNITIAQIYKALGKQEESGIYLERASAIGQKLDDSKIKSAVFIEMGTSMLMQGNLVKAFEYLKKGEEELLSINLRDGLPSIYNNLGAIKFYQGDFGGAIVFYEKSQYEARLSNDPVDEGVALLNIGEANTYLGNYSLAEKRLKESLKIFKSLGNKLYIVDNYEYLNQLELKRKDFQKSLEYFKLKDVYEDSILNQKNLQTLANLSTKYETEIKEQEIKMLKAQTTLNEVEIKGQRRLMVSITIAAILVLLALILINSRRRYKLRAQLLEEKSKVQRTRFRAVIDGEEQERKRIARELHDGLGQILSTARIIVSSINEEPAKLQKSISLIDHAVDEVRSISHNLMPNALIAYGVKSAVEDMFRTVKESTPVVVKMTIEEGLSLEEQVSIVIYRVLQECLNNTLKYANASELELDISKGQGLIKITYKDNGSGFDMKQAKPNDGIGLSNMQSRIELIGGSFEIVSKLGEGTSIYFSIPDHAEYNQVAFG